MALRVGISLTSAYATGDARRGARMMIERAKASLHAFGVEFDVWFSERTLHEPDRRRRAVRDRGHFRRVHVADAATQGRFQGGGRGGRPAGGP